MRLIFWCLLAVGCGPDPVDACSGFEFASRSCVTFHLVAEPALVDARITSIAMWVTFENPSTKNQLVQTLPQAQTPFPIAVGLALPSGISKVRIEGLNGPGPAAYQVTTVNLSGAQHLSQEVMMQRPEIGGCFNNTFNNGETDVDCGGDCPPCNQGRHCKINDDCISATCLQPGATCM